MDLIVCMKRVPDSAAKIRVAKDGKSIDRSGVDLDLGCLVVSAGDVPLFRNGFPASEDSDRQRWAFHGPDVDLQIDLGAGDAAEEFFSCDLTEQYVHINATYTT